MNIYCTLLGVFLVIIHYRLYSLNFLYILPANFDVKGDGKLSAKIEIRSNYKYMILIKFSGVQAYQNAFHHYF